MRVAVEFSDDTPAWYSQLAGAPQAGDLIELNGLLYVVQRVRWNANPAPMRGTDITLAVTEEAP